MKCKAIQCKREAVNENDFCATCQMLGPYAPMNTETFFPKKTMSQQYPQYYKDVSTLAELDVYTVHQLFDIQDSSGAIQHASKKLLLSGVRTGGKSAHDDVREARDTLNRWLQLNPSPKQPA